MRKRNAARTQFWAFLVELDFTGVDIETITRSVQDTDVILADRLMRLVAST